MLSGAGIQVSTKHRKSGMPGDLQSGLEALILASFLGETIDPKVCFTLVLIIRKGTVQIYPR